MTNAAPALAPWSLITAQVVTAHPLPVAGGVDLNGDRFSDVVIGGPLENEARGRLMVFYGSARGLSHKPDWIFEGQRKDQHIGATVAVLDVNGDGISDVVTTQWQGPFGDTNDVGGVLVFFGSTNGLPSTPSQSLPTRIGQYRVLLQVKSAGDVNSDGYDDLAVGYVDEERPLDEGNCILVFHGSPQGLSPQPNWVQHCEPGGYLLGHDLGSAGDVNRDGYGDLLVGDMKYTGKYVRGGKAYLFLGSALGLQQKPAWTSEYPLPVERGTDWPADLFFSAGLSGAGDVNRDGYDDVIVGASYANHGEREEGAAFLYRGTDQGLPQTPDWVQEGNQGHVHFGSAVASAGDVDRDGFGDVLVGVPYASRWAKDEGAVLVYRGSSSGLASEPAWVIEGELTNGHLGEWVGSAGDVNGDGIPDLLMAGFITSSDQAPVLRAMVVFGPLGPQNVRGHWSPKKPWLAALQQRMDRIPTSIMGLSILGCSAAAVMGLLLVQRRLRRRLAASIQENRQLAAEQERTRIARDIHDHLGADLTQLAAQLDRAAGLENSMPPGPSAVLPRLRSSAQKAVKTLDELVWATDPRQDSLEGLANYLAEFAPVFLEAHGLACDLDLPPSFPAGALSSRIRHHLFLVAKEALRNAVRHAGATRVRVALSAQEDLIELTVEDNGRGLPKPNPSVESSKHPPVTAGHSNGSRNGQGNGLSNMKARADELGGTLSISSPDTGGTRVRIAIRIGRIGSTPPNS